MKGRKPNAAEKLWMDKAADAGCIVCRLNGIESPAEIHHIDGKTKEGAHFHTIGLCPLHHRIPDTHKPKRWISRHGDGIKAFEAEYGTENELYLELLDIINE
jgi:hypothetical protein